MRSFTVALLLPVALATHYEDPANGCGADEQPIQVTGVSGDFCSPPCKANVCPTDPPSASDAKPTCALKSSTGSQFCALVCTPGSNGACPTGATCQSIQSTGICTYPGGPAPGPAPPPSPGQSGKWSVLAGEFSAVTVGINFRNDKVGWTTKTSGSSLPTVVKTTDSGATWAPVVQAPATPLPMGVAAKKGSGNAGIVGVTGFGSTSYSLDGDHFNRSIAAILVSQDIKFNNGRMTVTQASGVCVSTTNGVFYSCHKVPFKYGQNGRYSSSPSADVIYTTAGTWPSKSPPSDANGVVHDTFEVTRNLRMVNKSGSIHYEVGPKNAVDPNSTGYIAELWKSSDGGKTWKNLIAEQGTFYFNDIHCIDDTHCVAVGEGFAADGSTSPGARVYTTEDGETFKEVHRENTTGGESLMAAKMLSATEHWAGGTTKSGGLTAPVLALHSTDAGKTYTNEHGLVLGQMITSMDFVSSSHGYATTVNALQVSSLLQYGVAPKSEVMKLASASPQAQCKATSYAFCCEVGKVCDCTKGVTAPGQCEQASYAFCCSVGAPCDCSQPPFMETLLV